MSFKAGSVTAEFKAKIDSFISGVDKAKSKIENFGNTTKTKFKPATTAVNDFSTGISRMATNMNTTVTGSFATIQDKLGALTQKLAIVTTGVAGFGLKVASDFEYAMNSVAAVTGATGESFDQLREQAKKMGSETVFSAKQAAEGQKFLGMAGFDTNEILLALPDTLALASAANIELGTSADIVSNIMGQFQLGAEETTRVVDSMAQTTRSHNTNIVEMAEAMNYLGPTASALGISVEEASAVIGLMADNGLKGSIGTRALGTSLVNLTKPTEQMQEVMNSLNLDFFDAQGEFVGLAGMVEMLEGGLADLNPEMRQNALSTLFGAEAIQELNILMAEGSDTLRDYTKNIDDSEGVAKTMQDTMEKGLAGSFKSIKSALEGLSIAFFDLEIGGNSIIEWAGIAGLAIADFIRSIDPQAIVDSAVALYDQFLKQGVETLVNYIINNEENIRGFFDSIVNGVMAVSDWMANNQQLVIDGLVAFGTTLAFAIIPSVVSATIAFGSLAFSILAAIAPFVLVGVAVFAVIQLFRWIWENVPWVQEVVEALWLGIQVGAQYMWDVLVIFWDWLSGAFDGLMIWVQDTWDGAVIFWDWLSTAFDTLMVWIQDTWDGAVIFWEWLSTAFSDIITWFGNLQTKADEAGQMIRDGILEYFEAIKEFVITILEGDIIGAFTGLVDDITDIDLFQAGVEFVQGFINGIKSMFESLGNTVSDLANKATTGVTDYLNIQSPSKVTEEFGKFFGEGFEIGIKGKIPDVSLASAELANASTTSVANSATFNNNFNITGSQNPRGVAKEVMSMLAKQNNLAFNGVNI